MKYVYDRLSHNRTTCVNVRQISNNWERFRQDRNFMNIMNLVNRIYELLRTASKDRSRSPYSSAESALLTVLSELDRIRTGSARSVRKAGSTTELALLTV